MGNPEMEKLFVEIMKRDPAERLRIAAGILEDQKGKTDIAIFIAQSAIDEVRFPEHSFSGRLRAAEARKRK